MRKPTICICKKKAQTSFAVTAKLISAFVFATRIVQFLFYLHPKFQASSSFLSLYRPVCVGPGRKPRRPVFSRRGSIGNGRYSCCLQNSKLIVFVNYRYCLPRFCLLEYQGVTERGTWFFLHNFSHRFPRVRP